MSVKINQLQLENVKRIKACVLTPTENGLTVIGGNNGQGKTSVLDAIAWALGGERYRPSNPQREGSVLPPSIRITLSNGLVVERKGKNSTLKVTDPAGNKSGQQVLNAFIESLALDLPKFMDAPPSEKANMLLQVIGVGHQLMDLEQQEKCIYNQRHAIGQIADQKKKFAEEMPYDPTAPAEPVSISALIQSQQKILAKNGDNQLKRSRVERYETQAKQLLDQIKALQAQYTVICSDLEIAKASAQDLQDQSTAELEKSIAEIDQINCTVRANLDRDKALDEAKDLSEQHNGLTGQLEQIRTSKMNLLNHAKLPLEGLSVSEGNLTYQGHRWDCLSGAEQLMVATAIVRAMNPNCGFVLLDKLEQMDAKTLDRFGQWLQGENLQAIATRVSTGAECSIIIEDGIVEPPTAPKFIPGQF